MMRFALAAVIGSTRRLLAVIIAVLAIAGTAYLISHKLSNPDHYAYGSCGDQGPIQLFHAGDSYCSQPTRATWQIPLAVVIAILGSGAAIAVASRPWRPRHESVLSGLDL